MGLVIIENNKKVINLICAVTFASAVGKNALAKGAHAGNLVREVAKVTGGKDAAQSIYHIHFHLLGGEFLGENLIAK